jgi:hypothetical protein
MENPEPEDNYSLPLMQWCLDSEGIARLLSERLDRKLADLKLRDLKPEARGEHDWWSENLRERIAVFGYLLDHLRREAMDIGEQLDALPAADREADHRSRMADARARMAGYSDDQLRAICQSGGDQVAEIFADEYRKLACLLCLMEARIDEFDRFRTELKVKALVMLLRYGGGVLQSFEDPVRRRFFRRISCKQMSAGQILRYEERITAIERAHDDQNEPM